MKNKNMSLDNIIDYYLDTKNNNTLEEMISSPVEYIHNIITFFLYSIVSLFSGRWIRAMDSLFISMSFVFSFLLVLIAGFKNHKPLSDLLIENRPKMFIANVLLYLWLIYLTTFGQMYFFGFFVIMLITNETIALSYFVRKHDDVYNVKEKLQKIKKHVVGNEDSYDCFDIPSSIEEEFTRAINSLFKLKINKSFYHFKMFFLKLFRMKSSSRLYDKQIAGELAYDKENEYLVFLGYFHIINHGLFWYSVFVTPLPLELFISLSVTLWSTIFPSNHVVLFKKYLGLKDAKNRANPTNHVHKSRLQQSYSIE